MLAERESWVDCRVEDAVAATGAGTAPTVTTPANTTVIRRTATETGTMLYARMGLPR